ncbi:hypothetical protein BHQ21_25555 [Mycobacterium sherrisii]|uniref:Secreted protein n=1 Tax=Mycobacterium sherrisii TaxID=243061 RepID=A0A1E3SA21_9MYCO|nr:hypothetical protein BHQ21_25555 [Mycobacterium sherrisii]
MHRQALITAVASFSNLSAVSWYAKPNTSPATSRPVLAPNPAVNTVIAAYKPSPVATTALPAAHSAFGSTARIGMCGIVVKSVPGRYSPQAVGTAADRSRLSSVCSCGSELTSRNAPIRPQFTAVPEPLRPVGLHR